MESLVLTRFTAEADALAAYKELTDSPQTEKYLISQQVVFERGHGTMRILERYNAGVGNPTDSTLAGMMADLMDMLAGPMGPLLMGQLGFITTRRSTIDSSDVHGDYSMLEQILSFVKHNGFYLITIVQEEENSWYNAVTNKYECGSVRFDAAYAKTEVEYGRRIARKLKREAIKLARARRGERYEDRVDENRTNLQRKFNELRG